MEDWLKFLIIVAIVPLQYLIVEHYNAPVRVKSRASAVVVWALPLNCNCQAIR
jgi:hypothetical protein